MPNDFFIACFYRSRVNLSETWEQEISTKDGRGLFILYGLLTPSSSIRNLYKEDSSSLNNAPILEEC